MKRLFPIGLSLLMLVEKGFILKLGITIPLQYKIKKLIYETTKRRLFVIA